jgi:predicted nucleic acid-binding protein
MNKNEVYQLLCDGELTLAFDTNVVFNELRFLTLCDNINRLNEAHKTHLCMVVSAIVHTEKLFDLKQKYKEKYNIEEVNRFMERKHISVVPFERCHAQAVAHLVGEQFPTNEQWRAFKRQSCINCLGIKNTKVQIHGSGKKCGATVDWLIAGYAIAEECLLITDDKGKEFKGVKTTTFDELEAAVNQLLQSLTL